MFPFRWQCSCIWASGRTTGRKFKKAGEFILSGLICPKKSNLLKTPAVQGPVDLNITRVQDFPTIWRVRESRFPW
jgi:hypothetical protein